MFFCIVFGGLFLIAGSQFYRGRALFLAPGWMEMEGAERERVRIGPLCKNIGGMLCLAGVLFLAGAVSPAFRDAGLGWAMVGWLVLSGADLAFIETSGRYACGETGRGGTCNTPVQQGTGRDRR